MLYRRFALLITDLIHRMLDATSLNTVLIATTG